MTTDPATGRGADEIERDLAAARQRLADNIGSLIGEVHPKAVVHRTIDEAKESARQTAHDVKAKAKEGFERLKAEVKDEDGWRVDRLAAAGGVIGLLALVGLVRGLRR
ncbi:MAG: DUF3618 domain-containing protein [Propionibacteriaceae bacterium]|nr:DUF3618 domain-containing protein [Propionibacteriaceae bacterium]